jgi:hypothetical protein
MMESIYLEDQGHSLINGELDFQHGCSKETYEVCVLSGEFWYCANLLGLDLGDEFYIGFLTLARLCTVFRWG